MGGKKLKDWIKKECYERAEKTHVLTRVRKVIRQSTGGMPNPHYNPPHSIFPFLNLRMTV